MRKFIAKIITLQLIALCLIVIFSSTLSATAAEPIAVQIIQPPSETNVDINTKVELVASATGGSGQYYYRWYANDEPINTDFNLSTCVLNITLYGTYRVGCIVADANATVWESATAPEILLFVNGGPMALGTGPSATEAPNPQNQDQTLILAAIIGIVVIAISLLSIKKIRKHKATPKR